MQNSNQDKLANLVIPFYVPKSEAQAGEWDPILKNHSNFLMSAVTMAKEKLPKYDQIDDLIQFLESMRDESKFV